MKVQERLLAFLVQCCLQILHDIPESTLTSDSFPVLPEPQLKSEAEIHGFEALGVMAAEAPYRLPAQLDFHLVESLLAAGASAAEDHLWALREDPGYFCRALLETKDHSRLMLKGIDGNDHPLLTHCRQKSLGTHYKICCYISILRTREYIRTQQPSKEVGFVAKAVC